MDENLKDAIMTVVNAGFEVSNKRGGYISKDERFGWYHQTFYRSTCDCGEDAEEALSSFLSESDCG